MRRPVAENTNTPVSLLEKLAEDENEYVRCNVAKNTNTPASALEKLAENKESLVRMYVASNANTPVPLLEKLAEDEYEDVRIGVAENANTPVPVLEKLAEDENMYLRKKVAGNAETPDPILEKLQAAGNGVIKKIIVYYTGFHTDYDYTIYYPNGISDRYSPTVIEEEEGVEAILVLIDEGDWTITFSKDGDGYELTDILNILKKNTFKAVADYGIELGDTTGYSGELHLNGEIVSSDGGGGLKIKNATEVIDSDWEKTGERDAYEVVVESTSSPEVKIIFENGWEKMFKDVNQAIVFIEQNI